MGLRSWGRSGLNVKVQNLQLQVQNQRLMMIVISFK